MKREITLAIGTLVGGLILNGFAWSTSIREPIPTISLVAGLLMSVVGFIMTIYLIKKNRSQ
ncbi:hypothetical protein WBG78_02600 [Chryseolinea sp. T2]